jgi:hypothetical protein
MAEENSMSAEKDQTKDRQAARAERLATALKANLRRRKAQARGRASGTVADEAPALGRRDEKPTPGGNDP